jgi:hypothetical protein
MIWDVTKLIADQIVAPDRTFLRNMKIAPLHFLPTRHPYGMLTDLANMSHRDIWLVEKNEYMSRRSVGTIGENATI